MFSVGVVTLGVCPVLTIFRSNLALVPVCLDLSIHYQDCLIESQPWSHTMEKCRSESIPRVVHCSFPHKTDSHALFTGKLTFVPCFPTLPTKTTNISSFRLTSPWDLWRRRPIHQASTEDDQDQDSFHSLEGNGIGGQEQYPSSSHRGSSYHHTSNEYESESELDPSHHPRTNSTNNN